MAGFEMKRLGLIMEPEPGNPFEVEGVPNPAGVRRPLMVSFTSSPVWSRRGISRLSRGIARVKFNKSGQSRAGSTARHRAGTRPITSCGLMAWRL